MLTFTSMIDVLCKADRLQEAVELFELMEWELREEEIEIPVIEKSDAIKAGVKMAILAGFILGMGTLVMFGITYIVSKYVQDREEFDGWGCFVAELPKENKKKAFWWIDRIIGKWFLENVNVNEYDARLAAATKYIATSPESTVSIAFASKSGLPATAN